MANRFDSLRTPLSRVRHLGSARSGTRHAWRMRVTSMALLPLTLIFVVLILSVIGQDYATVRAFLGAPLPAILMILFLGTGIFHMMLGMQTIIEDYIHGEHIKTLCLMLNTCFAVSIGLACVYAVLRLSFTQ